MTRVPRRVRRAVALTATVALLVPIASCGGGEDRTITVLAAASLTDTFTELAHLFEADNPGVSVELAFDSSATLAQQAVDGAPADVLATADLATMQTAEDALVDEPRPFATNTMVLATPGDNPAGITRFADLDRGDVTFVTCVPTAPCGKVAAALLEDNAVTAEPASLEVDVRSVLAKVTSDEADAGLVYATDAVAAGDAVRTFDIPHAGEEVTTYPIAPLDQTRDLEDARRFVALVHSEAGRRVLADAGFGTP
jgi:molybdate transport system substrate-binding protein